jgi:ribosomal-protein-alanine N-acetyltransferase
MTREESDRFVSERIVKHFDEYGYGLWAVDRSDSREFIGFVGLMWQQFEATFTPALEVGWRLSRAHWGQGFATEAAAAALQIGFNELSMSEIVSMTSLRNTRSIAVMQRLGMSRDPADDFDHPRVPVGHPLRRHVLYRITADGWKQHVAAGTVR